MKPLLFFFFLLTTSLPAGATSLLPLSLEQVSSRADLIFYGEVISNEVRKDPVSRQIVTFTQFRVLELVKGQVNGAEGKTHTIKQLGGSLPGSRQRLMVHGIPVFVPDKQYVVFLPKPSQLGFCSPLGLHQGSFAVTQRNGERIIGNGSRLAPAETAEAPVYRPSQSRRHGHDNITHPRSGRSQQLSLATEAGRPDRAQLRDFLDAVRSYNAIP
ncbi:MAG TPA: hypothetical protein ENJ11_03345 [Gammaproteobacteria bacterium]|nr:hypothetical protein [Gammaproteobacteria bacterium]